jgi:hypothetical protein
MTVVFIFVIINILKDYIIDYNISLEYHSSKSHFEHTLRVEYKSQNVKSRGVPSIFYLYHEKCLKQPSNGRNGGALLSDRN